MSWREWRQKRAESRHGFRDFKVVWSTMNFMPDDDREGSNDGVDGIDDVVSIACRVHLVYCSSREIHVDLGSFARDGWL